MNKRNPFTIILTLLVTIMTLALPQALQAQGLGIKIMNEELTAGNVSRITERGKKEGWLRSGTITYDTKTQTLTLNEAEVRADAKEHKGNIIYNNGVSDLKIRIVGSCSLWSDLLDNSPLNLWKSTVILGSGLSDRLELKSPLSGIAIYKGATLTLLNCSLNVSGGEEGIAGFKKFLDARLVVDVATVQLEASGAALRNIDALTLKGGVSIIEPTGGSFDASEKMIVDSKGNAAKKVVIREANKYKVAFSISPDSPEESGIIMVKKKGASTWLTSGAEVEEGTTITWKIQANDGYEIDYLQINGNKTTKPPFPTTLQVNGPTNLVVRFKKDVTHTVTYATTEGGILEVKDADGNDVTTGASVLPNSKLTFVATANKGYVFDKLVVSTAGQSDVEYTKAFQVIEIKGDCKITAYFKQENGIAPATPTESLSADKRGIYTLEGIRLYGPFEVLPEGIYIVDGKKVIKH